MATSELRLPDWGYTIVSLDLEPDVLTQALEHAKTRAYITVFAEVHGADDPFRLQSRVKNGTLDGALCEIDEALTQLVKCCDPRWTPTTYSFMRSLPGGKNQGQHQDYTAADFVRAKTKQSGCLPGSAIIALEEGTRLRVYPGCFTELQSVQERIVTIPVGFALIFRGNLIHSGVSYDVTNHRLHCYLSNGDKAWKPDQGKNVRAQGYFCGLPLCSFGDEDMNKVKQHRYLCEKNPNYEKNKEKRRNRGKRLHICTLCEERTQKLTRFKTDSGFYKHLVKHHGK